MIASFLIYPKYSMLSLIVVPSAASIIPNVSKKKTVYFHPSICSSVVQKSTPKIDFVAADPKKFHSRSSRVEEVKKGVVRGASLGWFLPMTRVGIPW